MLPTSAGDQAASAVREFKPKIVYPYHYRGSDLEKFKTLVGTDAGVEVRLRDWWKVMRKEIMAGLTLGAILAHFTLRSNVLRGILFSLAIPIAIAVNILRVFILIAVFHFLAIDLSEGTFHTILGIAVFAVAFGLFLLAGKGLALCKR